MHVDDISNSKNLIGFLCEGKRLIYSKIGALSKCQSGVRTGFSAILSGTVKSEIGNDGGTDVFFFFFTTHGKK